MPPIESYFGSYTIESYTGPEGPLTGLMKEGEKLTIAPDGSDRAKLSWGDLPNTLSLQWSSRNGGVLFSEPAQLTEHGTLEVPLRSAGVGMDGARDPRKVTGDLRVPAGDVYTFKATKE